MRAWFLVPFSLFLTTQLGLAEPKQTLKIGVILPLSGPMQVYGQEVLQGAQLALALAQEAQPYLATRVSLAVGDSKGLPGIAEAEAHKILNEEKVHMLFGGISVIDSQAISRAAADAGKPFVTPAIASEDGQFQTTYVSCILSGDQGQLMSEFVATKLAKKKAVLLQEVDSPYSEDILKAFSQRFQKQGGHILATLTYNSGQNQYDQIGTKLAGLSPEVVILPGHYSDVEKLIASAQSHGMKAPFVGSDTWDIPQKMWHQAKVLDGNFFLTPFSSLDPHPTVQKFKQQYIAKYQKEPGMMAAVGYDGIHMVLLAFDKAKNNSATNLMKALASTPCYGFEDSTAKHEVKGKPFSVMKMTATGPEFFTRIQF